MGKKTKVAIDTNVIISAFGWHGKPEDVVKLATTDRIKNFISLEMLAELRKVVAYPKLNFSEILQAEIIETVFSASSIININESVNVIIDDPPDNRVLEVRYLPMLTSLYQGISICLISKPLKGLRYCLLRISWPD